MPADPAIGEHAIRSGHKALKEDRQHNLLSRLLNGSLFSFRVLSHAHILNALRRHAKHGVVANVISRLEEWVSTWADRPLPEGNIAKFPQFIRINFSVCVRTYRVVLHRNSRIFRFY